MSPDIKTMVIYGGTFDPFHRGHEAICSAILKHPLIDQLRLIPCYLPALKAEAVVGGEERLQMLYRWQSEQSDSRILVDSIELDRKGPSYTLETLLALQKQFPDTQLILAMGTDAWQSLPRWKGYEELRANVNIWVFTRLGQASLLSFSEWSQLSDSQELTHVANGHFFVDTSVQMDISSTFIRSGPQSLKDQVPSAIFDYINEHHLYRDTYQKA